MESVGPYYQPNLDARGLVNAAWAKAEKLSASKESKTVEMFDKALGEAGAAKYMTPAAMNFGVNVEEPDVLIPRIAEAASIENFQHWWTGAIDTLADQFADFIKQYFPNECGYLQAAQRWICDTLEKGGTGINPIVEQQIWARDRSRLLADARSQEAELLDGFAARRYPIPPGAAVGAVLKLRGEAAGKIAQASRDVAIKQAEIEIENVKFAVDKAISLYSAAMGAAGDYIKSLVSSSGNMSQLLPSVTDSQSRLIGAAADYYRARIQVEDLRLKAAMPNGEWRQQANVKNVDNEMQAMRNRVDAAIEAAKAMAQQASAALNAMHASASMGDSVSNGTSFGISHNWSYEGN